ncbi:unnamed protein product [Pieris macdunnoughi]|uniref:RRM domain-containing protein n=1 Tax=Pieris macdunnoughi TaxID=345717 RepID=A0A821NNE1_9NEOP|nr:unnamed protein product [Pieris macdunnoughi]
MLMAGALPAEPEGLLSLGSLPGQKDTTWTKLFVGGLPYHTTDKSLREHFAVYGDIEEAVVITDRQTSKSRGYGFVIMGDRAAAERACKDPNPIIDGRKANVNLAILGAKPRGNLAPGVTDWIPVVTASQIIIVRSWHEGQARVGKRGGVNRHSTMGAGAHDGHLAEPWRTGPAICPVPRPIAHYSPAALSVISSVY